MIQLLKGIPRLTRRLKPGQFLILGFLLASLIGAGLLMLPVATVSGSMHFTDAWFTTTSAVCVTGLTVVNPGLTFTLFGQIVILVLIQIGGLGIMTIASLVFMLVGKRISLRERLLIQESFNADSLQGLVRLVRNAITVTFIVEGCGALILCARLIPQYGLKGIYYAVFTAVSAFCNAGFDPFGFDNSIEPFLTDPTVNFTLMFLVALGGIGFAVITDVTHNHRFSKLRLHSRIVLLMTAVLIVLGTVLMAVFEWNNPATLGREGLNSGEKLMGAAFQSISLRTAGFATFPQGELTPAGQWISIVWMFIGASPASTGGGIKTTTVFVVLLAILSITKRRQDYNTFRRRLGNQTIKKALTLALLAILLVLTATVTICAVEVNNPALQGDHAMGDVLFEVVSAMATVGLSTGITPGLSALSEWLIILLMFIGRLGPLTFSIALSGGSSGSKPDSIHYPEGRLMIG